MSANKSQNLKLHLWEPEDNFLRAEFNENFAAIDTAVKAEQVAREQAIKAGRASIAAVQTLASQALADANLTRYAFGGYLGNNRFGADNPTTLEFGFTPSFLLVVSSAKGIEYPILFYMETWKYYFQEALHFTPTETGISWYTTMGPGRQMTVSERHYFYFAFR